MIATWIRNSIASVLLSTALILTQAAFAQEINCGDDDIDDDNDGLIEVCTLEDLDAIRHVLDGTGYKSTSGAVINHRGCPPPPPDTNNGPRCRGYELVRDLDFNDNSSYRDIANKGRWTSGRGWLPIGEEGNGFKGILNGNGYTLSNLFIDRSTNDKVGLFGELQTTSTIVGMGLLDVAIRGKERVGGLAGRAIGAVTITRSYSRGQVSGTYNVGGLVGDGDSTTIADSHSSATVSGLSQVGGLVGTHRFGSVITGSYSSGRVSGTDRWIGGLVGWNNGMIINSYNNGSVSGGLFNVGGLVGYNESGTILNSYSSGSVSGRDVVGGLVGNNGSLDFLFSDTIADGTILNSYSSGSVSGRNNVGGLVGYNRQKGMIRNSYSLGLVSGVAGRGLVGQSDGPVIKHISNSYWNTETSQLFNSNGGTGKTTAMLQEPIAAIGIYREWSEADWDFGTANHYPAIKYTPGPDTNNPACGTPFSLHACGSLLPGQKRIQVVISTAPLVAINITEDNIVILEAAPGYSISDVMQIEGSPLAIATINASKRWFLVPPDLVAEEADRMTLRFQMTTKMGTDTQQTTVSVVVAKINNGNAVLEGFIARSGNALTAPMISASSDVDGGVSTSSIGYQWQKCVVGEDCLSEAGWSDTRGTSRSYSVVGVEARRNNRFRVVVSYRDGQGYNNEVISRSIAYLARPDTLAPVFTMDWSRFSGGASAVCDDGDIDNDNDGLIEICHLEDLNAVRYELDGSGYQFYGDIETGDIRESTKGCGLGGCNGYELVRDLDFNDDDSYLSTANRVRWTTDTGWLPIGTRSDRFRGVFDGNGYTLSNLRIDRPSLDNVGLFGALSRSSTITRIGLLDVTVRGKYDVGGLAGRGSGTITNSYSSGRVSGAAWVGGLVGGSWSTVTNSYSSAVVNGGNVTVAGGLVGWNGRTINDSYSNGSVRSGRAGGLVGGNVGIISNSYNRGTVHSTYRFRYAGGLVGWNARGGIVTDSYNIGAVTGIQDVGGLVGWNQEEIKNSYNLGRVSGSINVGGIVGLDFRNTDNCYNRGSVSGHLKVGGLIGLKLSTRRMTNSHNSGPVTGTDFVGGLVGEGSYIHNSYNSGPVSGGKNIGGLVGQSGRMSVGGGPISNSYNSGSVSGRNGVGGVAGLNQANGVIRNTYNRGTVSGDSRIGGLVGINSGRQFTSGFEARIFSSYSIGRVTSTGTHVGGLVGENQESEGRKGFVGSSSYWDIETSQWLTSAGGTSQTTVALQTPTTAGGIYQTWDSDVWDFGTDIQYPRLKYTTGTDVNNCGTPKLPCGSLLAGQLVRQVAIATQTSVRVGAVEGETMILNARTGPFAFRWTQISTPTLVLGTTDTAELRFLLPADVVSREATTRLLTLRLTVSTGTTTVRQQTVQIVVNKVDNDVIMNQPTIIRSKNRLMIEPNFLATDADGVGTVQSYQWQKCLDSEATTMACRRWGDVSSDGTNAFYLVPEESVVEGDQFRVKLTYTDGQGYSYSVPIVSTAFAYQLAVFLRLKLFLEGALQ